jgi:drug/metabolite transporter (DMT)-like permease
MADLSASPPHLHQHPPGRETDLLLFCSSLDEVHDNANVNNHVNNQARSYLLSPSTLEVISESVEHMLGVVGDATAQLIEEAVDVKEAVVEAATDMQEAVAEEVTEIADTLMEELYEFDDGNTFLEMSLTRNSAILPTDIERAVEVANFITTETSTNTDDMMSIDDKLVPAWNEMETLDLITEAEAVVVAVVTTPLSAYLLLAMAVISLSAIGPLLEAQKDVNSTMKICWRQFATSCLLFPFAVVSVRKDGLPRMTSAQWFTFFLTSFCYTIMCVGFAISLEYTAVGNAVILCNSQSLLLLAGKMLVGQPVSATEATGALVAFSGAIFCSIDSSEAAPASAGGKTFLGDFLGIVSAFGGVGYLIFAKQTRSHMSLYVFMYLNMLTGSLFTLFFITLILREPVTFDCNETTGVFGWMNMEADRLPLEIAMVIWCNCFGALGYIRAMQFFDNLVLCVAALVSCTLCQQQEQWSVRGSSTFSLAFVLIVYRVFLDGTCRGRVLCLCDWCRLFTGLEGLVGQRIGSCWDVCCRLPSIWQ